MAGLLTNIDPKLYCKYVTNEEGRTVLYVKLRKDLHGMLQAVLLFWKNLTLSLQEWVFEVNPYNWCVVKKTVDENI